MRARAVRSVLTSALLAVATLAVLLASPLAAQTMAPIADAKAVVLSGQVRFTVLAPRLIRLEWSPTRQFEDRASLVFINRQQPVPAFRTETKGGWLTIVTDALTVRYRKDSGRFAATNLEVRLTLNGIPVVWRPGMEDKGNLKGTTRTLDGVNGPATKLEPGLVSRDGWAVVDDAPRLLYDNSDWPWVTPRPAGERQDLYFFGYGHDYRGAMADFTKVAGRIPMPPRFAFGVWWSRYWAYTDQEFKQLVEDFDAHTLPLDVLVVDMDWHRTFGGAWGNEKDASGHTKGWTGFTWDRNYFPEPAAFLQWTDAHGLRTPLNLHPASGIQPWEEQYPAMAAAMGLDPATKQYVPFDIVNKKFARNFFDLVIHPFEKQGIDFWWLDWQQNDTTSLEGINPTWWLNYTFFTDMERQGRHRPLIFHRWGGLGNHRYQVGFSGDTYSTWQSLAYQPYFTATAANVGFGYWSHDIGGHMEGPVEPELYARWIQFGTFSPVLRTHTTKNPGAERRIWAYPAEYAKAMRDAFLLRYSLIPYIYTASRQTYDSGVPFLRPTYWDFPEADEAYRFTEQYLFGDQMLIAPVVAARNATTGLASRTIWLPPGSWVEWFSGRVFKGPLTVDRPFALDEIPIFVKSGSIVPTQPPVRRAGARPDGRMILDVFPGDSSSIRIYQDQGDSTAYQSNECAWTTVRTTIGAGGSRTIDILPVEGSFPDMPSRRAFDIRWRGTLPPTTVAVNGRTVPLVDEVTRLRRASTGETASGPEWWYDGESATTVISLGFAPSSAAATVTVTVPTAPAEFTTLLNALPGVMRRLRDLHDVVNGRWPKSVPPDVLLHAVQTGNRMSLEPTEAQAELAMLARELPAVIDAINRLPLTPEARQRANALIAELQAR
ncbi:MAG TPA: TIM-barrel domain-containing protein [Vicinamibacterales bacterium]|jgi:alpha-glucosidase